MNPNALQHARILYSMHPGISLQPPERSGDVNVDLALVIKVIAAAFALALDKVKPTWPDFRLEDVLLNAFEYEHEASVQFLRDIVKAYNLIRSQNG